MYLLKGDDGMGDTKGFPRIVGQQCDGDYFMIEVDETNSRTVDNRMQPPLIYPPMNTQSLINHGGPWDRYEGPPERVVQLLEDAIELDVFGDRLDK